MKNAGHFCALALGVPLLFSLSSPVRAGFLDKAKDIIDRTGGEETRDRETARQQSRENVVAGAMKAAGGSKMGRMEAALHLGVAAMAAQRAKLKANTAANGLPVGLGDLKWGMSASQVQAMSLGGKRAVSVTSPDKNVVSFEWRGVKIFNASPRVYTAQVWLRKNQLNFAELRPQNESRTSSLLGTRDSDKYFAELTALCNSTWKNWNSAARELQTDRLQSTYNYQVPVARRTEYAGQQSVLVGFNSQGGAVFGSAPVYNTITTYEQRQKIKSRNLPFNAIQDDWKASKNASYRIALLRGGGTGGESKMGIARWQAQREGGAFPFLITSNRSIKDLKGVMNDINANYNVFPHTTH